MAYGSYSAPSNIGSGGNTGGTSGGGAVILNIASTLTVNGSILADGAAVNGQNTGSGGSIYITAGYLTGAGTLSAQGGGNGGGARGGSGGRVAVIASTATYSGAYKVYGANGPAGMIGAAGTLFIKTPGTTGTLIIDNTNLAASGYSYIAAANYNSAFDGIQLNHQGRLDMTYPSTFTLTSTNVSGDGTGELRPDGLLTTPASLSISSYTLSISSFSSAPNLTYLDIGYAGTFNLGGSTQTPVVNLSSVTIESSGTLTHWANSTAEVHKLNLTLSSMTILSGGRINVTGQGYAAGNGPGACASGGSYGGDASGCSGLWYGSYLAPTNLGSGAISFPTAGGGAAILNITNTLQVSGSILADGGAASGNQNTGSGGSIYITAGTLSGAGTISAQGGNANSFQGGSGGRVSIIASTASYSGTYRVNGGTGTFTSTTNGAAGTLFIKTPGTTGTLIIDNTNLLAVGYSQLGAGNYNSAFDYVQLLHKGKLWIVAPSSFSFAASNVSADGTGNEFRPDGILTTPASLTFSSYTLTVSSFSSASSLTYLDIGYGGIFNLGGNTQAPVVNLSSVTIESSGTLTHWANSTTGLGEVHKLNLTLSTMTVLSGGQVNVTGKGYAGGNGPGTCGNSGSYGGDGSGCSGLSYGSYLAPINLGSGGSTAGGGAVILNVTNTVAVSGSIVAEGATTGGNVNTGSGGSIYITAAALSGNGTLSAQGGNGGGFQGGSGGRIAVIGSTGSYSGSYKINGGTGTFTGITNGASGTLFLKVPGANGTLIANNAGLITNGATYLGTSSSSGTYTFDSIFTQGKSSTTFVSYSTVTISPAGNVFGDGDFTSTVTINGNLYGGSISNVTAAGLTATWGTSPNASLSQTFTLDASTAPDYSGTLISSVTLNRNATLSTLAGGTTYYLRVRPGGYVIAKGIPNNWAILGSTCTSAQGVPSNPLITNVYISSLTVAWGTAAGATGYTMDASTAANFTGTVISSVTNSVSITTLTFNSGQLSPNTTYFVRVGSLSGGATSYANTTPASTSTLTSLITSTQAYQVFATSITANWTAMTVGTGTNTSEGYELDASTAANFTGQIFISSNTTPLTSTLTVTGLSPVVTYFLRAGAVNWNSVANYVSLGSTRTLSFGTTFYWTGVTNTTWTVASNWSPTAVPGPTDIVVIDTGAANQPVLWSTTSIYSLYIATSGAHTSSLTDNFPLTVSSGVIVGSQGTIYHTFNTTTELFRSSITASFMIIRREAINTAGLGYQTTSGPGYCIPTSGATYGGEGNNCGFTTYGSFAAPIHLGSGSAGWGGGASILNISGTLTLNVIHFWQAEGAGATYGGSFGGSIIFITAGALAELPEPCKR